MHFSYVKTKFLHRWLNILCNYVHSRTFSTPKIHPHPTTPPPPPLSPATRPCKPPYPTPHPTLPATSPGPPPHQGHHHPPCWHSQAGTRRRRYRCHALVPSSSFCKGCMCGVQVNQQPYPIFYTPHQISYIPYLIFLVTYLIFFVHPPIIYVPPLILYEPYLIF